MPGQVDRRQPKPKPAAAHGITITELKEMTRARLVKEAEEKKAAYFNKTHPNAQPSAPSPTPSQPSQASQSFYPSTSQQLPPSDQTYGVENLTMNNAAPTQPGASIWGNPMAGGGERANPNPSPWAGGITAGGGGEDDYSWVAESVFKKSPHLSESRVVDWTKNDGSDGNPNSNSNSKGDGKPPIEDISPKEVARRSIMNRKSTADSENGDSGSVKSVASSNRSPHQSPSGRKARSLSGGSHAGAGVPPSGRQKSKSPKPRPTDLARGRSDSSASGSSPNIDIGARMLKVVQQKYESGEIDQEEKELRRKGILEDVLVFNRASIVDEEGKMISD